MRQRLRSLLWRVPVEQEVQEELTHHRELRVNELVDRGWPPEAVACVERAVAAHGG